MCDNNITRYMDEFNDWINNDPMAYVLASFLAGLLFSGTSWGIIYVLLFLVLWEILYFCYSDANNMLWNPDERLLLVLAALLGYLTGAFFHDDDNHYEAYHKFKDDIDYYGKEFDWFE